MGLPVVLFIFNRPDFTTQILEAIRAYAPRKFFVVADGPRATDDSHVCHDCRTIATSVDWDCCLKTNFSGPNMGNPDRLVSGIDWVFSQVEEAIILEDDCLPSPDFFQFCEEVLPFYKDDSRIALVTGTNFFPSNSPYSYYFSLSPHIYGWATWKSSWARYDRNLSHWPEMRDNGFMQELFDDQEIIDLWTRCFDICYDHPRLYWDNQVVYSSFVHHALTVTPYHNLVCNIGGGPDIMNALGLGKMTFPLRHPPCLVPMESLSKADFRRYMA